MECCKGDLQNVTGIRSPGHLLNHHMQVLFTNYFCCFLLESEVGVFQGSGKKGGLEFE